MFDLFVSDWDYFCIKEFSKKLIFYSRGSVFSLYLMYVNLSIVVIKKLLKALNPF